MPRAKKQQEKTAHEEPRAKKETPQAPPRLYRSSHDRILGGVAGGLGEYFQIDPTLVRIIFILLALFAGGFGVLLYFILWFVLPSENDMQAMPHMAMRNNMNDFRESVRGIGQRVRQENSSFLWVGGVLVVLGLIFLSNNFGFFRVSLSQFWPLLLIFIGILLLFRP